MKRRLRRVSLPGVAAVVLTLLLLVLASLQYLWTGQLSRAERERARAGLQAAAARLAEDFDRELTRAFLCFLSFPPASFGRSAEDVAAQYDRWTTTAPHPELIRAVLVARFPGPDALELSRLDPASGRLEASEWPPELAVVRERLAATYQGGEPRRQGRRRGRSDRDGDGGAFLPLLPQVPALVVAQFGRPGWESGGRPFHLRQVAILWLDAEAIRSKLLPELVSRHLVADGEVPYQVLVVLCEEPRQVIYRHGVAADREPPARGDAVADLFALLPAAKARSLALELGLGPPDEDSGDGRRGSGRFHDRRRASHLLPLDGDDRPGGWRLVITHPAGSLEAAVTAIRHRNLTISLSILVLLGLSALLILVSARRAQRLARLQMEFIAGTTHELLTPLAAMRSAGQNLADGVVREPDQVRRYGKLIDGEGRRLATMVEQVLEFAGMQAGGRSYRLRPVAVAAVIDEALAICRPELEAASCVTEVDCADDLPQVMADPPALQRAVRNLIGNAVKYAAAGGWIGVRAGASADRAEVVISVEDRGPGIAAADLPHLFEPFYRGSELTASQVPGSGLGLSLVKHVVTGHGGRVEVAPREGGGSRFTLHLPAGAPETALGMDEDVPPGHKGEARGEPRSDREHAVAPVAEAPIAEATR